MDDDTDVLLNRAEAAAYLKIAEPTLKKWKILKKGPPCFVIGRRIRYRKSDLRAWVAEQEAATRAGDQVRSALPAAPQ